MHIDIVGDFDKNTLCCMGSLTKQLTTFVCLSFLSEKYALENILDDDNFLDTICNNQASRSFLHLFQKIVGSQFSLRDLCSYYTGLPYTFDVTDAEIEKVDAGSPFKHHSVRDEATFLALCEHHLTPVYSNRSKFHYSEVSIIFLGYLIEKAYSLNIEELYQTYLIQPFNLKHSVFSRTRIKSAHCEDLSPQYDYPAIAIQDHGYFCYSNGFYTTMNDMKILIENMMTTQTFKFMTDLKYARAASNRLLNGLTIEIRIVDDDIIYGYEGLSFSGCTLWAYSTKHKQGYLTHMNNEEAIYTAIYDDKFNYSKFDAVPNSAQTIYNQFIKNYHLKLEQRAIPAEYQGTYTRVNINESTLQTTFLVGNNFIVIRNPDEIKLEVIYVNANYHIKCKDNVHGSKVGFSKAKSGNHYLYFDGNLYKKQKEQ